MRAHQSQEVRPQPCAVRDAVVIEGKLLTLQGEYDAPRSSERAQRGSPLAHIFCVVCSSVAGEQQPAQGTGVLLDPALVVFEFGHQKARLQLLVGLVPDGRDDRGDRPPDLQLLALVAAFDVPVDGKLYRLARGEHRPQELDQRVDRLYLVRVYEAVLEKGGVALYLVV